MQSSGILELAEKARSFALDGDYYSSITYYDECKGNLEKNSQQLKTPQMKRLYDEISQEMNEVLSIIKEVNSLQDILNCGHSNRQSSDKSSTDDQNSLKNNLISGSLPPSPPSKRMARLSMGVSSSSVAPLPRHTVDVRGHRIIPSNQSRDIRPRMTTPARLPTQEENARIACTDDVCNNARNNCDDEESSLYDDLMDVMRRFAQQYKGSIDLALIHALEDDVVDRSPNVTWDCIAGLSEARGVLEEALVWPQIMPDFFKGIRRPWQGILLFGPPGTGKTLLAKAIATECKTTFFNVSSSTLTSKWRGESEKLVRILFEMARFYAPSTIFLDEVDALGGQRNSSNDNEASLRVKSELLVQMDGVKSSIEGGSGSVTVLGATNLPWNVDEALRRRFEKRIYIPLPDEQQRIELFKINLKDISLDATVNFDTLAKETNGYSGSDIATICRDASLMFMRQLKAELNDQGIVGADFIKKLRENSQDVSKTPVTQRDLESAIKKASSSVGIENLQKLDSWMKEFGAE